MKNSHKNPIEIVIWAVVDQDRTLVNIYDNTDPELDAVAAFFYQESLWHNIVLSRVLYESLPKESMLYQFNNVRPLYIISDDPEYTHYDPTGAVQVFPSVAAAIEKIHYADAHEPNFLFPTFIIDGGNGDEFSWSTLQCCQRDIDRIVLIQLDKKVGGPRTFPFLDEDQHWKKGDPKKFPRFPGIFPHEQSVYENIHEKPLNL